MKRPLIRYLDVNGDGTGIKNAVGDYNTTPTNFTISRTGGSNEVITIARLIIYLEGPGAYRGDRYGGLLVPLPNGVRLIYNGPFGLIDLDNGIPVINNNGWGGLCFDNIVQNWGAGNDA